MENTFSHERIIPFLLLLLLNVRSTAQCHYIPAEYSCLLQGRIGNVSLSAAKSSLAVKGHCKKSGREWRPAFLVEVSKLVRQSCLYKQEFNVIFYFNHILMIEKVQKNIL